MLGGGISGCFALDKLSDDALPALDKRSQEAERCECGVLELDYDACMLRPARDTPWTVLKCYSMHASQDYVSKTRLSLHGLE